MPRNPLQIPSYRRHKASGQAVVTIAGKDHYLGKHGSAESQRRYDQLIQEWLASNRKVTVEQRQASVSGGLTINELSVAYWAFAQTYYVKDGEPTRELQAIRYALRPLVNLYGATAAGDFGPLCLKAVRQQMIDDQLSRALINRRVNRIRRLFKWGVENELAPAPVLEALRAVAPLKRGRCNVKEAPPVKPAPQHLVDAVQPFVSRQVWAMIRLQLLTGMRPGEVVAMRQGDVDTSPDVWVYLPSHHKTEHHGYERKIYLGPQAQEVVSAFLDRPGDAYLFSPKEAEAERRERMRKARKTPLSCGNRRGTSRKKKPRRRPGPCYDVISYRRAICQACQRAFPWPHLRGRSVKNLSEAESKELKAWRKAHHWHPHQLRHNAATFLRQEFGVEAARLILGHQSVAITELYAELDHQKAVKTISEVG